MILDRNGFMERIKARLGEDTSDEAVSFLEDMTDTFNHLEELGSGNADWKAKYEQNDRDWRAKYTARFFGAPAGGEAPPAPLTDNPNPKQEPEPTDEGNDLTEVKIDDLFTESEV